MGNKMVFGVLSKVYLIFFVLTLSIYGYYEIKSENLYSYVESNIKTFSFYVNEESVDLGEDNRVRIYEKTEYDFSNSKIIRMDIDNVRSGSDVVIYKIVLSLGINDHIVFNANDIFRFFSPNNNITEVRVVDDKFMFHIVDGSDPFFYLSKDGLTLLENRVNSFISKKISLKRLRVLFFVEITLLMILFLVKFDLYERIIEIFTIGFFRVDSTSKKEILTAIMFFLSYIIFTFNTNPFAGEVLAPLDLLLHYDNSGYLQLIEEGSLNEPNASFLARSDVIDANLPNKIFTVNMLLGKDNRISFYKMPALNFTDSFYSPGFFIFFLFQGTPFGFYLVSLLNLMICGIGSFILSKRYLPFIPALFIGFIYIFSGQMVGWFYWQHVYTFIWFPWIFWGLISYLETEEKKYIPVIVISTALMIGGGFPAVAAFALYALFFFVIYDLIINIKKLKEMLPKYAIAFVIIFSSCGIMSFTVFPYLDKLNSFGIIESRRGGTVLDPSLISFLWDFKTQSMACYPEHISFIGKISIVLSSFAVLSIFTSIVTQKQKKVIGFFIILALICILISFGFVDNRIISYFPVFKTNNYTRLNFVTLFALSMLSGFGFYMVSKVFSNLLIIIPKIIKIKTKFNSPYRNIINTIVFICMIILFISQIQPQIELFRKLNYPNEIELWYPKTKTLDYLISNEKPLEYCFFDSSYFPIQGVNKVHGLFTWFDHSFKSMPHMKYLERIVPDMGGSKTACNYSYDMINFSNPDLSMLLTMLNIGFVVLNSDAIGFEEMHDFNQYWNKVSLESSINVYSQKNDVSGAFYAANLIDDIPMSNLIDYHNIVHTMIDKKRKEIIVDYKGESSGYIVLPLPTYSNLNVKVNGVEADLEFFKGFIPAVVVDKGDVVTFYYMVDNLWSYISLSLVSLFLIIIIYYKYDSFIEILQRLLLRVDFKSS